MKNGDVIAGYRIISEPTNANGGKCMWAFAEKDGQQFFLKRFLEPKRPREGSTASAATAVSAWKCARSSRTGTAPS